MLIFQPEIKERTNVPDNQGTATVLLRFVSLRSASTKIGDVKMDRHDRELLDNVIAVMFLVGVTLGGVLSEHETKQAQITSIE
jgi:hypothetical protein